MALLAEFEVDCEALPLVEVARAVPSATLTVEMVPHADTHTPFLVEVVAGSPPAVERELAAADFVAKYATVDAEEARYKVIPAVGFRQRLGGHVDDLDGLRTLASNDATIERIEVTPRGWRYTGRFADRDALGEFREFWHAEGYPFRLSRLTHAGDDAGPTDGLTRTQREALLAAHEMGYFEIPRGASLDGVATELGISASSLSERLRRAQTHLIEERVRDRARRELLASPDD